MNFKQLTLKQLYITCAVGYFMNFKETLNNVKK